MPKILLLPQHPRNTNGGGIMRYCEELNKLFQLDSDYSVSIARDIPHPHKFWGAVYDPRELETLIIDSKCDIVHINGFATLGVKQAFSCANKLGKKIAYTPHWHPFWSLKHNMLGRVFFKCYIEPSVKTMVDGVITFNNEDTKFFNEFNSNVIKIPHWMSSFSGNKQYSCKRIKNMILFVGGRLNETNKGVEHLYRLPEGKYNIHFVGVGNVPTRSDITVHSNISDEELMSLYHLSSLVVVPSRYESFSYVTLEALVAGASVVISDRVRIGDYISECPKCRVFKFKDFEDFNIAVKEQISVEGDAQPYLRPFLPDLAIDSYKKFYNSLLNRSV